MNIVKRCTMNCSPREGNPPCEDCEDHDADIIEVRFDKTTHWVMRIPTSNGEHISHTLGGFKGAFVVENGTRPPTEQEIFDAGVRSGMGRAKQESGWRDMDSAPMDGTAIILGIEESEGKDKAGFSGQGRYYEGYEDGPDDMGHDGGFMDYEHQAFEFPRSFGNEKYITEGLQPTKWMPLPIPPTPKANDQIVRDTMQYGSGFGKVIDGKLHHVKREDVYLSPDEIAALKAQKVHDKARIAYLEEELSRIRTQLRPLCANLFRDFEG